MRITIVGAGAIGGLLAARLAESGAEVRLLARGRTLEAIQTNGLRIATPTGIRSVSLQSEKDPVKLGLQDVVIIAVKATSLARLIPTLAPMIGDDTAVVCAMNGIPWWFFADPTAPHAGLRLQSLDPNGLLTDSIPARQLIGCVVHLSSKSTEPGLIEPGSGKRLILGEALGGMSEQLLQIVALLCKAGFEATASTAIRAEIWYKLWGNMTLNPLSAITDATCDRLLDDPMTRQFCLDVMQEAATIGMHIGCPLAQSGEERMQLTRQLGAFKTSMLQDVEMNKPLEIDALIGAVREIGQHIGIATPRIDYLLGTIRVFARQKNLY